MFQRIVNAVNLILNRHSNKEIALDYIQRFAGKIYHWGGDDPMAGFDCSGLAVEYLKAGGLFPRKADMTAGGLLSQHRRVEIDKPSRGCLVFWKNSADKIIHVEICLNAELSIGASGGGRKTKTETDAIRDNAFIKIRAINSRKGIAGYVDPWK